MIILLALLVIIWFICVNAILLDTQIEYEANKRKIKPYTTNKFYPVMTGNGKCSDKDFFKGDLK